MQYVFVDMDGVIAEYGYPSGAYDGEFKKGNYIGKKPVQAVIDEIINKYNNSNYAIAVCSAVPNTKATFEKDDWLNNYFKVPYENRIYIRPDEDKVEVIRYYIEDLMHGSAPEHAIIIDDKGSVLAKAHELGIECYHPTQLLAKAEQEKAEAQKAAEEAAAKQEAEKQQQEEQTLDVEAIESENQEIYKLDETPEGNE